MNAIENVENGFEVQIMETIERKSETETFENAFPNSVSSHSGMLGCIFVIKMKHEK